MALGSTTEASRSPALSFKSTMGEGEALFLSHPYSGNRVKRGLATNWHLQTSGQSAGCILSQFSAAGGICRHTGGDWGEEEKVGGGEKKKKTLHSWTCKWVYLYLQLLYWIFIKTPYSFHKFSGSSSGFYTDNLNNCGQHGVWNYDFSVKYV